MHKHDHEAGVVRFKVTGGYPYREGLRANGFEFDRLRQYWWLEVPAADTELIEHICDFLKAADKIDATNAKWRNASR